MSLKKIIISFFTLLIGTLYNSQKIRVTYVLEGSNIQNANFKVFNLDIDKQSSFFYPIALCEKLDVNTVYMKIFKTTDRLSIHDGSSLPLMVPLHYNFQWRITKNTKEENDLKLKEAIGTLNGKEIKAWFSTDLPLNEGPFIFNGLPGLITEIIIPNRNVSFKLRSISKNEDKWNKCIDQEKKQEKEISLKRYKDIYIGFNDNFDALIKSFDELGFSEGTTPLKQNSTDLKKFNILREIL